MMAPARTMPRGPLLEWGSFSNERGLLPPAVDDLPCQFATTSGRAAIFQALKILKLAPGTSVLVPTYHCPTMVAPVVQAGLTPVFYPMTSALTPHLDDLVVGHGQGRPGALLVAHYFGFPRSMLAERTWCDQHGVALIEDCAHAFFGQAGERPIGHWGDLATASITKFFPVPEAGLLGSARRVLHQTPLRRQAARAELLGLAKTLALASDHNRWPGLSMLVRLAAAAKRTASPTAEASTSASSMSSDPLQGCDLRRCNDHPLAVSRWITQRVSRPRLVATRRANAQHLIDNIELPSGARWFSQPQASDVPYVLPLWLDRCPDEIYHALRSAGLPVLRWDQCWRGMPTLPNDFGLLASKHVVQILCHQSLTLTDMGCIAAQVTAQLRASLQ